jgi:hypothetical protein
MEAYENSYDNKGRNHVRNCCSSSDLEMLMIAFPEIEPSIIRDIFFAKDCDVCNTTQVLSGLMVSPTVPSNSSQCQSNVDVEDVEWIYHDDMEDAALDGSVDWVVVENEWEVVTGSCHGESCQSYSDVLVAPYVGDGSPFQVTIPTTSFTKRRSVTQRRGSLSRDDSGDERMMDDYYRIKEFGQRRAHIDRTHPRKVKSKSASKKITVKSPME